MPAILLPLLLAAAAPPPAPSRTPVDTLAPDAEARWVPFDLTAGNQIRFAMTLDGRRVTAILDTGVSMSVLSRDHARASGLRVTEEGRADVIGGTLTVGRTPVTTLTLGGLTRRGGALLIADLPATATGGGHDGAAAVDLLVGRDLTAGYALDIDYQARRFRLLKSGRMPFAAPSAPLSIAPDRQLYVTTAALAGRPLRPMVVDTGDGAAVTVAAPAWAAAGGTAGATTTIS
uniref:retropepsin-like aspartic protease n=2 Tax=Sphingomonadaceae TaxID=41297 RepID=UPI000A67587C